MNQLSIMQWNACSLNDSRQRELEEKCNASNIDVIVVCEARTKKKLKGFDDYLQFVNNDTLLLVNKRLQFEEVAQYRIENKESVETIAISVEDCLIIGAYCRNGQKADGIRELMKIVQWTKLLYKNVCIIGELNARSTMVYDVPNTANTAGRELSTWLENETLYCLNDGVHTFQRPNQTSSVLDLCSVSQDMMSLC